jgi:hypothetical protein
VCEEHVEIVFVFDRVQLDRIVTGSRHPDPAEQRQSVLM